MFSKLLTALLCTIIASSAMAARSLERAMETTTEAVSLPVNLPSSIDARGCLQCQSIRMQVPATAKFYVGDQQVTLKQLRDYSLGKQYNMVIFYELETPVVRRIVVSGSLANR
jgi:hypothetical protein